MKAKRRQYGMSLMEQTIVIAAIASLLAIGLPSAKHMFDNMETPGGAKNLISSALASAKAMAVREQQYVGVRFQHAWDIDNPLKSPLDQPQYMIFIIYRPPGQVGSKLGNLFTVIEGIEPIKLPENIGVMDWINNDREVVRNDQHIDTDKELWDLTTFSIVFSPAGKLVYNKVHVRNRDNKNHLGENYDSEDDIFNSIERVRDGHAMFLQDDYDLEYTLTTELSRQRFRIYDRNEFRRVKEDERYRTFLHSQEMIYLNAYTGTFIQK